MAQVRKQIAGFLLQSKAIILEPAKPFRWASGWLSPIYCDNRITLSYPGIRNHITEAFVETILTHFGQPGLIAGVATGAIAQGALVADRMNLPLVYVRSAPKAHGRQNLIEGRITGGEKVVVVEDLVSTGGSSLRAVEILRESGAEVLGMAAIFTYGFRVAEDNFREAGVPLVTLSDYDTLISLALESGYIRKDQLKLLEDWKKDPSGWGGGNP
ncbi:MAG TPA: orotate phosphoribosyltransferase [Bacteroides sp.]|nr:orotate phosphoribosyltransferase [Bacteroides sp.]